MARVKMNSSKRKEKVDNVSISAALVTTFLEKLPHEEALATLSVTAGQLIAKEAKDMYDILAECNHLGTGALIATGIFGVEKKE